MRIETNRVATPVRLEHAAAFHSGEADLVEQAVPIVTAALERCEPVAVAVQPSTEHALAAALGRPAGLTPLAQPQAVDGGSGQTSAARRARELRALTVEAGAVTVLSEHTSRLDGLDGSFWTEFDAAVNLACADLPVSMTCFYPELPLHVEILRGARRNHPHLLVDGELLHNPEHRGPREVLAEHPTPAPLLLGPPDLRFTFSAWSLHEVRAAVEQLLTAVGYPRCRTEDVVLAVNEVASNAVEHGTIEAQLCIWVVDDELVCEVHDGGTLLDPLPGMRAPHPAEPRGRGVWIARQVCDLLHVWHDRAGTHVRVRAAP